MSQSPTPLSELDRRIAALQTALRETSVDAALMLQNTDLFYFSGTIQQSYLFVPAEGSPLLMSRKSYQRARSESMLPTVVPLASPKEVPAMLIDYGHRNIRRLGLELDVLPVQHYLNLRKLFPESELIDISHEIRSIRSVKSAYELDIIQEAATRSDAVFAHVPSILQEGATEVETAGKLEAHARRLGHQGTVRMRLWGSEMFYGHLMAGEQAAIPSFLASPTGGEGLSQATAQGAGFHRIQGHQPILVDYVFAWKGYLADETRIFSIGSLDEELVAGHEAMLALEQEIMQWIHPGVSAGSVYEKAMEWIHRKGYDDHFMGAEEQRIRFVGHGVGLELDEYPFIAAGQQAVIQENMVVAIEPKLVFPGKGVVGIEDTFVVTERGLLALTRFPRKVHVLE
ncbi:MAG: Xaa-Pro peptidase family protein [Thermodesulfobacteriota bacterium]